MTPQSPFHEALWQRTWQQDDFDQEVLAAALLKNDLPSYGLTLVLGCPLPPAVAGRIEDLKNTYQQIAPGRIHFGAPAAYHLTVYGLKRSRPAPFAPGELRPLLEGLGRVLRAELGEVTTLTVPLAGSLITESGGVLVCCGESEPLAQLRAAIGCAEGMDPPKSPGTHITIGQFTRPFGSRRAYRQALSAMEELRALPPGDLSAAELKLVYYQNRLLHDIVAQETIRLPVTGASQVSLVSHPPRQNAPVTYQHRKNPA
jgi:hypothetical protein